jgi:hypothetical protein
MVAARTSETSVDNKKSELHVQNVLNKVYCEESLERGTNSVSTPLHTGLKQYVTSRVL